ncbi:hypothetical protein B4923_11175 [Brenneria roseae subsp. americana]|uniref:Uncharacterized protein n=1 Tax=Brenneria roseae subsp. americana TaxID=1508507 RepID=A0A2U1TSM9_9GAMM|nr:hypothetical protein B4923_11175 [Brenneria roseae subsp. americana]
MTFSGCTNAVMLLVDHLPLLTSLMSTHQENDGSRNATSEVKSYRHILLTSIALVIFANILIFLLGRYPGPSTQNREALP